MSALVELRRALHRVADSAIDATDALSEDGFGERLDASIAAVKRNVEHVCRLHEVARSEARR